MGSVRAVLPVGVSLSQVASCVDASEMLQNLTSVKGHIYPCMLHGGNHLRDIINEKVEMGIARKYLNGSSSFKSIYNEALCDVKEIAGSSMDPFWVAYKEDLGWTQIRNEETLSQGIPFNSIQ